MIEVREAWTGGPLQQFAKERPHPHWGIPWATGGYAGSYICRDCGKEANKGIYLPEGVCSPCRDLRRGKCRRLRGKKGH
jgi:hypothetical protein